MSYQTAQDEAELLENQSVRSTSTTTTATPNYNFAKVALAGTISFFLIFALASYHSVYQVNNGSSDTTDLAAIVGDVYNRETKWSDSNYSFDNLHISFSILIF